MVAGSHAGFQLLEVERLAEVVIGAEVQAGDAIRDRRGGGQHQNPRLLTRRPKFRTDVVTVDTRQIAVEQDHVVIVDRGLIDGRRAVGRQVDRETLAAKPAHDRVREINLILDDQDAHRQSPLRTSVVEGVSAAHKRAHPPLTPALCARA